MRDGRKMRNNTASSPTIEYDERDSVTVYGDMWEAKQKIAQLFREKVELNYLDIMRILRLDLKLVVDICQELVEEGKIE